MYDTWSSPVFGNAFGEIGSKELHVVRKQMGEIATGCSADLDYYIREANISDQGADMAGEIIKEILPKTTAFVPALTIGEVSDVPYLRAVATAVGVMYWADQTMDRGSNDMLEAVELLSPRQAMRLTEASPHIQRIVGSLGHIAEKVDDFSKPQDNGFVLNCFYDQVLLNEAHMRRLSLDYTDTPDQPAFLAMHAKDIATTMTINAGFPSVSSSLYAIYRQKDNSLPPLSEVYDSSVMNDVLQTCNATVRLWDELGDWKMDTGQTPQGVFTINLFNEYHPAIIEEFCSLANIRNDKCIAVLQESFSRFHASDFSRKQMGKRIERIILDHIRSYMEEIPADVQQTFEQYLILCKRVLEIGYVNRIGDIALAGGTS